MASRCSSDPLDPADDVCDMCFGNYCEEHLVHTKGRKHPICLQCALRLSGVRSGGRIPHVGDPKTASRRRAELKNDLQRESPAFVYFDDPDANLSKKEKTTVAEHVQMGTAPTKTSKFGANLPAPTHSSSETKTQSPAPSTRRAEDLKDETLSEQQSVVQAPDKNERRAPARPSTNKDLAKSKHIDNPSLEALPPVITKQGTILDQIVQEKQHRAQRLAEEIANRIES